jgi:hypothetical protein
MLVKSVLIAAKIVMRSPAVGAVLAVIVVFVCAPMLTKVFRNEAHCVAVTKLVADTVASAGCPQPASADPVLQTLLTLAPAVVLTNPL